jgi:hypothetical protein
MLALRVSAVLTCLIEVDFGAPAPFVAGYLLKNGKLPTFLGLFPMYGGPFFERSSARSFVVSLAVFAAICTVGVFAGALLWNGAKLGAHMMIALLPIEAAFWVGYALPIPPIWALLRFGFLLAGWSSLRG